MPEVKAVIAVKVMNLSILSFRRLKGFSWIHPHSEVKIGRKGFP